MSHLPSAYPSPPYSQPEYMDAARSLCASAWHVLEQPPPPTLRDILHAYKSKGDGDRDMLLAMLNAKGAEDQRIAATATLHQKLLEVHLLPRSPHHDLVLDNNIPPLQAYQPTTAVSPPPPLSSSSSTNVTLPPIHAPRSPRKRARSSRSPSPLSKRRHSEQESEQQSVAPSDQLPPSPPFSSPGRSSTLCPELAAAHAPPRGAMAIGSLLSSSSPSSSASHHQETDSDWPSRTSSERERVHRRPVAKTSA